MCLAGKKVIHESCSLVGAVPMILRINLDVRDKERVEGEMMSMADM